MNPTLPTMLALPHAQIIQRLCDLLRTSYIYPDDPLTGANWEGVGITPDVTLPPKQAFDAAYRLALQSVLASLDEQPCGPLKALADEAQAALKCLE